MRPERAGTLAVLASAVGYGFLAILVKLSLAAGVRPVPLVAWRFVLGAVAVWLLLAVRRRPLPPRAAWWPLIGLGALYSLNALTFTLALQWVPATTASLVFFAYPVVVVLLAALFLDEKLTPRRLVAVGLVLAGCILTAGLGARIGRPLGILLVVVSLTSLSVYIVAGRSVLEGLPSHGSAAVIVTSTAIVESTLAVFAGGWRLGGGAAGFGLVALIAVVSTALPITLFVIGLKRIGAGRAAIFSTLEPVVTVAAAAALLGERIASLQYLGGALILAGAVWLRLERPLPRSEEVTPLDAP